MKVDIKSLVQNKVYICKNFNIQPSEIDKMPFWEYEMTVDCINELVKEENEQNKKEEAKYNVNSFKSQMNSYKAPSVKMPSF